MRNRIYRISRNSDANRYISDSRREHDELVALLSSGDFYREWCIDPKDDNERDQKKVVLNILLNKRNEDCNHNALYRRIRKEFPITFNVIEDIKQNDHRNLSKQLHRFTADVIARTLLQVQSEGIAAIPQVDALICQEKDRRQVCEALGNRLFETTGVCCKVDGIQYSPLNEIEEEALALDEDTIQEITGEELDSVRLVKCAAALKLIRRCPPVFAPTAVAALATAVYGTPE